MKLINTFKFPNIFAKVANGLTRIATRQNKILAEHPKFGTGTVTEISGTGANARIVIRFDDGQEKTLSLTVAPIVRMEENE